MNAVSVENMGWETNTPGKIRGERKGLKLQRLSDYRISCMLGQLFVNRSYRMVRRPPFRTILTLITVAAGCKTKSIEAFSVMLV